MKPLTKEEILKGCEHDGSFIPVNEVKRVMQLFSDQENTRLTAINEKQAELIVYLKRQLKKRYPAFDSLKLCKLESELQSLQSGEKEEIIKIDINDPDFNEPI